MHPLIHIGLKEYVERRYGIERWIGFLEAAGVSLTRPYVRVGPYPDEELVAIVAAIAAGTGTSPNAVLEDFGTALAPQLIAMYPRLVRPEWRSLDLLQYTEDAIHQVVRHGQLGARPPVVRCRRLSPSALHLTYESSRRLCPLAVGIMRGIGRHYGETLTIRHPVCMLHGADACEFDVALEPSETT
jgi:hypothetical protein